MVGEAGWFRTAHTATGSRSMRRAKPSSVVLWGSVRYSVLILGTCLAGGGHVRVSERIVVRPDQQRAAPAQVRIPCDKACHAFAHARNDETAPATNGVRDRDDERTTADARAAIHARTERPMRAPCAGECIRRCPILPRLRGCRALAPKGLGSRRSTQAVSAIVDG